MRQVARKTVKAGRATCACFLCTMCRNLLLAGRKKSILSQSTNYGVEDTFVAGFQ